MRSDRSHWLGVAAVILLAMPAVLAGAAAAQPAAPSPVAIDADDIGGVVRGPGFEGESNSAEASYYTWVDQHDTLGLGRDVPISTANLQDGFVALKDGRMILLRVPYPMGFYAKGFDGRIDDPAAGWKGRGLWSTSGDRTPWLMEGGKGSRPRAVHIQLRPDPLAK